MFKMSTIGMNTSTQACWSLVNRIINQRLSCLSAAVRPNYCTQRDVTWGSASEIYNRCMGCVAMAT